MQRYSVVQTGSATRLHDNNHQLVEPDFLRSNAHMNQRERVAHYNANLKVAGDSTMTLHKLRKLYIKHKVKWKKLKVEKQPNRVDVSKDDKKR